MKIGSIFHKNNKTGITLLLMLVLIGMTVAVSWRISRIEEQACWEVLHQSVRQLADELEVLIRGDQELLDSIADIAAAKEDIESQEVQTIIDGFRANTMISHIALLLPGDRVMLPGEPVRDTGGVLSFETEAALGRHISGRSVDIRDENRLILRSFVPVVQNGETVAMLYGVVDLKVLSEKVETTAYGGQAAVHVADGATGDFLVDTWHDTLGISGTLENGRASPVPARNSSGLTWLKAGRAIVRLSPSLSGKTSIFTMNPSLPATGRWRSLCRKV